MQAGVNDNHKHLHKLLDQKKRSLDVQSSKVKDVKVAGSPNSFATADPSQPCVKKAKAFCHSSDVSPCYSLQQEAHPEGDEHKQFSRHLFVEVFSGTSGLTASVKALGVQGIGIDSSVTTACKAPVLKLDLTRKEGQALLWKILERPNICGVHLAPPCGTSSRAREIPRYDGPCPVPL